MTLPSNRDFYAEAVTTLKRAGDLYDFDDIMNAISRGDMQSFANEETWVVTQIAEYPRRRALHVLLVVGTMGHAEEMLPQLEDFAKSVGATRIIANGRKGWASKCASHGWSWKYSGYYKEIGR